MRSGLHGIRRAIALPAIVAALALFGGGGATALGVATWTPLAPVPANGIGVEGMSTGVSDGFIVAAYGYDALVDTDTTRVYSMTTNSWSFGATAPGPGRSEGIGVMRDGKLYSIGGRALGVVLPNLERYHKNTDTWVSLAPMPTARAGLGGAGGVGPGRYLYAIGGRDGTTPCTGVALDVVERYDVLTDSWATMAPLPAPRSDLGAIQMGNGKIYVFGGCDASRVVVGDVFIYNIASNTWSVGPSMPTPRAMFYQVGFAGPKIYVMGGADAALAVSGMNEVFNTQTGLWEPPAPPMPTPRGEMGVGSNGGTIWTVGGAMPAFGNSSTALEKFRP